MLHGRGFTVCNDIFRFRFKMNLFRVLNDEETIFQVILDISSLDISGTQLKFPDFYFLN